MSSLIEGPMEYCYQGAEPIRVKSAYAWQEMCFSEQVSKVSLTLLSLSVL